MGRKGYCEFSNTVQGCLVYIAVCVEGSAGDKTLIRGERSKCSVISGHCLAAGSGRMQDVPGVLASTAGCARCSCQYRRAEQVQI